MKISFDLDGVITDGHHWFFELLHPLRITYPIEAKQAELSYYSSRLIKFHPNLFLVEGIDEGIIITARKPVARQVTEQWLRRYGILLPVFFIDPYDTLDWFCYAKASKESAALKARVIERQGVEIHFDNNPILVKTLRNILPGVKIILVGGENG